MAVSRVGVITASAAITGAASYEFLLSKKKKNVILHSLVLFEETVYLCWFMSDLCPEPRASRELFFCLGNVQC